MQKLDELELKEKKNECAGTDASGKSTELEQTKSPSKAVPKAGQQQQECRIRYVQETLEKSVPLEPPSHGRGGGGGQERMVPGEWNGPQVPDWSQLHERQEWQKTAISKGPWHGFPGG